MTEAENSNTIGYSAKQFSATEVVVQLKLTTPADHCPKADNHMLSEGLIALIEKLSIEIDGLKEEHKKIVNQVSIAREIASGTDNVDNLRLICNDMFMSLEHIIDKDSTLFNNIYEMLKSLREIFILYENMKK